MNSIGKYKIIKELGSGGFGAVYLAEDPHLGDKVAIKVFQIKDPALAQEVTSATGDAGKILKQRFLDEAKILRRLSASPHVVSVHEFETLPDGCPYYVMPYLPNSLVDLIGRDAFTQGKLEEIDPKDHPRSLPITQTLAILKQTLEGLKAVHEAGLVHRDIKPANLLLETKGQLHNIVLCDFGIAKMPEGEHSKTGVGMGSPNYVSPEQRESAKHVDARSDVFSVGVLAYRMLTGSVPMVTGQQPIKQFMPAISDELNDLVMNAMNFDTAKRPANAGDFLAKLKKAEAGFIDGVDGVKDGIENTSTWVSGGDSGLRDELKPLREEIAKLLIKQGEITESDQPQLDVMAHMADLDNTGLLTLIKETAQEHADQVKPKQKLIELIESKVEKGHKISEPEYQALLSQAKHVGWDKTQLNKLIDTRATKVKRSKGKAAKNSFEKKEADSNKRSPVASILALLLLVGGASGGYWAYDKQMQKDILLKAQQHKEDLDQKAWTLAESENTHLAYERYLRKSPQGLFREQAQSEIEVLIEEASRKQDALNKRTAAQEEAQARLKNEKQKLAEVEIKKQAERNAAKKANADAKSNTKQLAALEKNLQRQVQIANEETEKRKRLAAELASSKKQETQAKKVKSSVPVIAAKPPVKVGKVQRTFTDWNFFTVKIRTGLNLKEKEFIKISTEAGFKSYLISKVKDNTLSVVVEDGNYPSLGVDVYY